MHGRVSCFNFPGASQFSRAKPVPRQPIEDSMSVVGRAATISFARCQKSVSRPSGQPPCRYKWKVRAPTFSETGFFSASEVGMDSSDDEYSLLIKFSMHKLCHV